MIKGGTKRSGKTMVNLSKSGKGRKCEKSECDEKTIVLLSRSEHVLKHELGLRIGNKKGTKKKRRFPDRKSKADAENKMSWDIRVNCNERATKPKKNETVGRQMRTRVAINSESKKGGGAGKKEPQKKCSRHMRKNQED